MKKRVTAELISIAHRILKLKNHSETLQLQQEAKNLYDQLTILRFYEENFELVKNEISEEVLATKLEEKKEAIFEQPITVVEELTPAKEEKEIVTETVVETPILEEKIVVAELIVEDEEEEEVLITPMEETSIEEEIIAEEPIVAQKKEEPAKQISFEDMLVHDYKELDFVKVEDVPVAVEQANATIFEATPPEEITAETTETASVVIEEEVKKTVEKVKKDDKTLSLNDKLNKGINIGLNDRIAFEKKLFGGNAEDFNRVLSQLNTFDSFEEAKGFIVDFVKPDYNNWAGNEEYETRFLEIVEKKFS
ncbi:hypothetical protein [uncultured Flavobacterium sp.]|jgi:hypothetical protein|uniref:hypothetical protein n=1 Tax=uncultured Flavobacterium sp. TaxID=165435 RepID=UPI002597AEF0|nr:hypothetical protein [uncultured Flavobacterium sp.]